LIQTYGCSLFEYDKFQFLSPQCEQAGFARNSRDGFSQHGGEMQPQDPTFAEEMTRRNAEALQEEIARRAYELYEARGYVDGFDVEDWLQAEQDIVGSTPASKAVAG
jgi:hypothetical protein